MSQIIVLPNFPRGFPKERNAKSEAETDLREACMTRVPLEPTECFVTVN